MTGDESTSDATGGDDTTTGEPPALCTPGPSPSRRLTTQQYLNTLADLLPGVTLPPLDLPPNGRIEGFENIAEANTNGRTQALADTIFGQYLIPFEMISVLLLAALIGAIVLARRD